MRKINIIGGGLAGLYSAYSAASHGAVDVTLYEKGYIGSKHNCGEMFTEIYTTVPKECKLNEIHSIDIVIDNEKISFDCGENSSLIMTDKCYHELILKDMCLSLGVNILEKTKATGSVWNDYVIDASGTSQYKNSMGKAVVYIAETKNADMHNSAIFKIRNDLQGYSWVFPRGNKQLNIGEGVIDYKYKAEFVKPDFNILYSGGGLLPMPDMKQYFTNMYSNNLLMLGSIKVGNAAGLVCPLTGGGEHLAVVSGLLAGELVAKGKERYYSYALDEIVGDEMRFGISLFEFMRKQDMNSVKKIIKNIIKSTDYRINNEVVNKTIRKAMNKWMTIPDVNEKDLISFIEL
jgi:flavin-dependent dehydrogenase